MAKKFKYKYKHWHLILAVIVIFLLNQGGYFSELMAVQTPPDSYLTVSYVVLYSLEHPITDDDKAFIEDVSKLFETKLKEMSGIDVKTKVFYYQSEEFEAGTRGEDPYKGKINVVDKGNMRLRDDTSIDLIWRYPLRTITMDTWIPYHAPDWCLIDCVPTDQCPETAFGVHFEDGSYGSNIKYGSDNIKNNLYPVVGISEKCGNQLDKTKYDIEMSNKLFFVSLHTHEFLHFWLGDASGTCEENGFEGDIMGGWDTIHNRSQVASFIFKICPNNMERLEDAKCYSDSECKQSKFVDGLYSTVCFKPGTCHMPKTTTGACWYWEELSVDSYSYNPENCGCVDNYCRPTPVPATCANKGGIICLENQICESGYTERTIDNDICCIDGTCQSLSKPMTLWWIIGIIIIIFLIYYFVFEMGSKKGFFKRRL